MLVYLIMCLNNTHFASLHIISAILMHGHAAQLPGSLMLIYVTCELLSHFPVSGCIGKGANALPTDL